MLTVELCLPKKRFSLKNSLNSSLISSICAKNHKFRIVQSSLEGVPGPSVKGGGGGKICKREAAKGVIKKLFGTFFI